ncbi:MAG: hypothetical protein QOI55_106 [Actinomycetota bacterium]|jgi:hypothetical protein|nr:hypothetical protein [Actinomycetota bacterium]
MAGRRPTRHDDVPEADALDQAMPVPDPDKIVPDSDDSDPFDIDTDAVPSIRELPPDVPEADALEQATPVDDVDDDWR